MQACVCAKLLQSCLTPCDPMNCSLPDSSVHGILQARILEWAAMPSSRRSSQLRDGNHVSYVSCIGRQDFFLPLAPSGKPLKLIECTLNFLEAVGDMVSKLTKQKKILLKCLCEQMLNICYTITHKKKTGRGAEERRSVHNSKCCS